MNSWRNFIIVVWLGAAWLSGCVRDRLAPNDVGEGRVEFQLRGSGASGEEYRLRDAVMTVQGPFNTLFFDSEDDPNRTAWTAEVPVGSYQAHLQDGWRLERLVNEQPEPVLAELLSENPLTFAVVAGQTTWVILRFRLLDGEMPLGDFEIVLDVLDGDLPPGVCESATNCAAEEKCCASGLLGACIPSADPCPLPDLSVSETATSDSLALSELSFEPSDCAVLDGCVGGAGTRRLLRFDTLTPNLGDGDLILGTPEAGSFAWSACHAQYYLEDFMTFELLDDGGATVASGSRKVSCVVDESEYVDAAETPENARFHCGFQGIQRGWADGLSADLECQWVDVTDVAPGSYTLRVGVNTDESLPESNYDNNVVEVPVVIGDEQEETCESCTAEHCASQLAACAEAVNDGTTGPGTTGNRCQAAYTCISSNLPGLPGDYCMTFDGDQSPLSCACPAGMNALDCANGDPTYPPFTGDQHLACLPIMRRAANATGQPPASMGTLMFNFVDTAFAIGDALNIVACQLPNCAASCAHVQVP